MIFIRKRSYVRKSKLAIFQWKLNFLYRHNVNKKWEKTLRHRPNAKWKVLLRQLWIRFCTKFLINAQSGPGNVIIAKKTFGWILTKISQNVGRISVQGLFSRNLLQLILIELMKDCVSSGSGVENHIGWQIVNAKLLICWIFSRKVKFKNWATLGFLNVKRIILLLACFYLN